MNQKLAQKIEKLFPTVQSDKNIAPYTTFGVGGNVRFYLPVKTKLELIQALEKAISNKLPFVILAGGSNVIFSDKTLAKLVIHCLPPKNKTKAIQIDDDLVMVPAGVALADLIKQSLKAGLAGLESLSGIPGTVGGAVVGNAGAYGQSISDHLVSLEIFDGRRVRTISKKEARFVYRGSNFKVKPWFVLEATFNLKNGERATLEAKAKEIIKIRNKKYHRGLKCPGSFFKNVLVAEVPKKVLAKIDQVKIIDGKIPTGYLLEAVSARGLREGQIAVADFHGNLLMNLGGGTCAQTKKLATKLKRLVKNRFGITLEEEVRYML